MPIRRLTLLLLFVTLLAGRDWALHPAVVQLDTTADIIAIGDVHGDYRRLVALLRSVHVVDTDLHWSAGKAVVVFTGDMIDKGPRPADVLRLIESLRATAPGSGGTVIALMGNHEAEFLAGTKEHDLPAGAFHEFLDGLPYAARVNDWFFCHAGNTAGRTLAQIGTGLESGTLDVAAPDSLLEARLTGTKTWFAPHDKQTLAANAAALGVHHIVQGHQHNEVDFADGIKRHTGEMFQRYGLIFLIDVGMSEGVGDSLGAALRISGGKAEAVCPNGRATLLWDGGGNSDVGRGAPCR